MFFTPSQILRSIHALKKVHPFYGITFLTCKKQLLPVGKTKEFPLDKKNGMFLQEHHKINPDSESFFQPYKSTRDWLRHDYPSSGLQAINTQTFAEAFIHTPGTKIWGWSENYIPFLKSKLPRGQLIPMFDLSVWLYKYREWTEGVTVSEVRKKFIDEYHISNEELNILFDDSLPAENNVFQAEATTWKDLYDKLPTAPDAQPDQGGTLAYLKIVGTGPSEELSLEPAERLTLITGDNGLGKTFLLECAWWALTGLWPGNPAYPNNKTNRSKAEIKFSIKGETLKAKEFTIPYDRGTQSWLHPKDRPTIPGLIVYARVDGSFAIWDPAVLETNKKQYRGSPESVFSSTEVWDGLPSKIEGLIRDWVRWQDKPSKYPFNTFVNVLGQLSPPDLGTLSPGESVRVPDDPREIPTIMFPYGEVPIIYSSAGVKRIITLSYLIVWAWNEHLIAAEQRQKKPQRRMVILIDEMEAHLHPKWQRSILPALVSIEETLSDKLNIQFLIATHSPLVMASSETIFDSSKDSLVHLDLSKKGTVSLEEMNFIRFGDISSWLTSPIFELRHARSNAAEAAIEEAKKLQLQSDPSTDEVRHTTKKLLNALGADDKFWPRWVSFAEKHKVNL